MLVSFPPEQSKWLEQQPLLSSRIFFFLNSSMSFSLSILTFHDLLEAAEKKCPARRIVRNTFGAGAKSSASPVTLFDYPHARLILQFPPRLLTPVQTHSVGIFHLLVLKKLILTSPSRKMGENKLFTTTNKERKSDVLRRVFDTAYTYWFRLTVCSTTTTFLSIFLINVLKSMRWNSFSSPLENLTRLLYNPEKRGAPFYYFSDPYSSLYSIFD